MTSARNIRDWAFISHNKNLDTQGHGELKSVSSQEDKQKKPKKIASGKVSAGQKEQSARTSESTIIYGRRIVT